MSCNNIHSLATGKGCVELLHGCISCDEIKKIIVKKKSLIIPCCFGDKTFSKGREFVTGEK